MKDLIKEISNAKDYQLQACANRMNRLAKECTDNLSEITSRTIRGACEAELKKRNVPVEEYY